MQKLYELSTKNKIVLAFLIIAPFLLISLVTSNFNSFFSIWDLRLNDQLFNLKLKVKGKEPVKHFIIHVDFNDSSIENLNLLSTDRKVYADILNILNKTNPRGILFDIYFPPYKKSDQDIYLFEAARNSKNAYFPIVPQFFGPKKIKSISSEKITNDIINNNLWHPKILKEGNPIVVQNIIPALPELINNEQKIGHIFCEPDYDGVYRRVPLLLKFNDGYIPSISLIMLADYFSVQPNDIEVYFGKKIVLRNAENHYGLVKDISIPIDKKGFIRVNFAGKWNDTFFHYSFESILDASSSSEKMNELKNEIEGSLIIISDVSTAGKDHGTVPIESVYPLSGIYANLMNSVLTENYINNFNILQILLLYSIFLGILWVLAINLKPYTFFIYAILSFLFFLFFNICFFIYFNKLVNLIFPTISFIISFVSVVIYKFFTAMKRNIEYVTLLNKTSTKFVPNEFIDYLGKTELFQLKLGDQVQKDMSILFSDIRSFTSLSELMTPAENFDFINSYLKVMGPLIRENGGFVDKYIGDAIMALFPDVTDNAVLTSITMLKRLKKFNEIRANLGFPNIEVGIGIHTGSLMLGIIGEEERFNGTVISDAVNLSSRLESLTKYYGASILITERVLYSLIEPKNYNYRLLDYVKVKGKNEPVTIFEILVEDYSDSMDLKIKTKDEYEEAFSYFYIRKDFEKSKTLFEKIFNENRADRAAKVFIDKCNYIIKNGLPENWIGVQIFDTK